jgi:hypothetical protein
MYLIAPRRGGDVASCYADPLLAEKELGWKADFDLERMCKYTFSELLLPFYFHCYSESAHHLSTRHDSSRPQFNAQSWLQRANVYSRNVIPLVVSKGEDLWRWQSKNPTGFTNNSPSSIWCHSMLIFFTYSYVTGPKQIIKFFIFLSRSHMKRPQGKMNDLYFIMT